jgi:hypothetical protein
MLTWPRLLRHLFDVELEHSPNCGGELQVIAIGTRPAAVDH